MSSSKPNLELIYLDLSGNNIEHLPIQIFEKMNHLEFLIMANNMLTTLEFYPMLPQSLKKVDLRSNLIKSMESNSTNFKDLINIEELYLSQNLWECSCDWKNVEK